MLFLKCLVQPFRLDLWQQSSRVYSDICSVIVFRWPFLAQRDISLCFADLLVCLFFEILVILVKTQKHSIGIMRYFGTWRFTRIFTRHVREMNLYWLTLETFWKHKQVVVELACHLQLQNKHDFLNFAQMYCKVFTENKKFQMVKQT